jgi:NTE family protein
MASKNKTIALALGGGGARGAAHIGAIRALTEAGFVITGIAGTSAGALIGAAYASGKLDAIETLLTEMSLKGMMKFLDPVMPFKGFIEGEKIIKALEKEYVVSDFKKTDIPFIAVATDVMTGQEVWIKEGNLATAVRASISLPGLFTPVTLHSHVLVDGGLTNPVPVSAAKTFKVPVIAIELNSDFVNKPVYIKSEKMPAKMTDWLNKKTKPSLIDVIANTSNIMQIKIGEGRMRADPPRLLIQPKVGHIEVMDFHRCKEIIEIGYQETKKQISAW